MTEAGRSPYLFACFSPGAIINMKNSGVNHESANNNKAFFPETSLAR
jgi:hypothetical protein